MVSAIETQTPERRKAALNLPARAFAAIKAAGYSDAQLVEVSLAFATTVFTNVFNRINDTEIDFPAVAGS